MRILLIGAGPTALGAADRLRELDFGRRTRESVRLLEAAEQAGGLAASHRDDQGFLWDLGGHVVFSHYERFDRMLERVVGSGSGPGWNEHVRSSFVNACGRLIPYPLQKNLCALSEEEFDACVKAWMRRPQENAIHSFDDWMVHEFGDGIADLFLRPYNRKVWTEDPTTMSAGWIQERVAGLTPDEVHAQIEQRRTGVWRLEDSGWGPNARFRFPRRGGTGTIWASLASELPQGWLETGVEVVAVDSDARRALARRSSASEEWIEFDLLINTSPLDQFVARIQTADQASRARLGRALGLRHTSTHVVGVGLRGQPPADLQGKSWIYFPDHRQPFHRVTLFSGYSDDHVPDPTAMWSLLCETSDAPSALRSRDEVVASTVDALVDLGWLAHKDVLSRWHRLLPHGYPIPSLDRDAILADVQPWLQAHGIFSRGRFGGWKYEVANQDHSYSQGVEVIDQVLFGVPESTYSSRI